MDNIELMHSVFNKYGFSKPIPPAVRKRMLTSKRRGLVAILKKENSYNRFLGGALFIYFLLKRRSVNVSLMQSTLIFISFTIIATITLALLIFLIIQNF